MTGLTSPKGAGRSSVSNFVVTVSERRDLAVSGTDRTKVSLGFITAVVSSTLAILLRFDGQAVFDLIARLTFRNQRHQMRGVGSKRSPRWSTRPRAHGAHRTASAAS